MTSDLAIDDVASRAFASMLLERTADAIVNDGAGAADALTALAEDSGLMLEICAGLLYVTSFLTGAGDVPPEDVYAASLALQPDDDEAEPLSPAPVTDQTEQAHEPAPSSPSVTLLPLAPETANAECALCDCRAIGIVGNSARCMFHVDHGPDDGKCPVCGVGRDPEPDDDEAE